MKNNFILVAVFLLPLSSAANNFPRILTIFYVIGLYMQMPLFKNPEGLLGDLFEYLTLYLT